MTLFLAVIFLDVTPEAQGIKQKSTSGTTGNFCTAKETVNRMRRQPSEWEQVFANHVFHKGLICKIYKELVLNGKKQKNQTTPPAQII